MRILMLIGKGNSARYMYNALKSNFSILRVIEEESPNKKRILFRRIKKLGILRVIGQVLFLVASKFIFIRSKSRIDELIKKYNLSNEPFESKILKRVESINSDDVINELKLINPDVVIVNGTRIISKKVLSSTNAIFINTHLGITPKYRGVHGGYWAVANNDLVNCGTTVHLVDKGIDTGNIIYQDRIEISSEDNYCTYPIHQIFIGIQMMNNALKDIEGNNLKVINNNLESNLFYHPDILTYFKNFVTKKVK